jgi:hypothetical protein
LWSIEKVEEFCAELQPSFSFRVNENVFEYRKVDIFEGWPRADVAALISKGETISGRSTLCSAKCLASEAWAKSSNIRACNRPNCSSSVCSISFRVALGCDNLPCFALLGETSEGMQFSRKGEKARRIIERNFLPMWVATTVWIPTRRANGVSSRTLLLRSSFSKALASSDTCQKGENHEQVYRCFSDFRGRGF